MNPSSLRLNVWAPRFPSPSGVADYAGEQAQALAARATVTRISESEAEAPHMSTAVPSVGTAENFSVVALASKIVVTLPMSMVTRTRPPETVQ